MTRFKMQVCVCVCGLGGTKQKPIIARLRYGVGLPGPRGPQDVSYLELPISVYSLSRSFRPGGERKRRRDGEEKKSWRGERRRG